MNWIESLRLKNYQSHEDSVLNFVKGINVIVGASNKGKTSIVRGLQGIYHNNPKSENLIQHDKTSFESEIALSNQYKVRKERTANSNRYFITFPDGNIERFQSFGNDVPKLITDILKAPTFKVDKDTDIILNFSSQLDPPFLLTERGPIKSKVLSKLTGGNVLDQAIKLNTSELFKLTQKRKDYEDQVKKLKEQIQTFSYLDNAIDKVNLLLTSIQKYEELKSKISQLTKIVEQFQNTENILNEMKSVVAALTESDVHNLYKDSSKMKDKHSSLQQLQYSYDNYVQIIDNIKKHESLLNKLILVPEIAEKINEYNKQYEVHKNISAVYYNYSTNHVQLTEKKTVSEFLQPTSAIFTSLQQSSAKSQGLSVLINLHKEHSVLVQRIRKGEPFLQKLAVVDQISLKMTKYIELFNKCASLTNSYKQVRSVYNQKKEQIEFMNTFNELPMIKGNIDNMERTHNTIRNLNIVVESLLKIDNQMKEHEKNVLISDKQLSIYEKQFSAFDICPLCEQSIKH